MDENDLLHFILKVLSAVEEPENHDDLMWRTDGEYAPITFFVNCNDMFWWATADCEDITPENVHVYKESVKDLRDIGDPNDHSYMTHPTILVHLASALFCCRVRNMRPQGKYYNYIPKIAWPLFDACGPERDLKEFGNTPKPQ